MARRYSKKPSYKKTPVRRAAPKRRSTRRAAPREQTIKFVLQHVMASPQQALPVMGPDGPMALPAAKKRGSKL